MPVRTWRLALLLTGLCIARPAVAYAQSGGSLSTFTEDVAPILHRHCTSCHRPGNIVPMSLMTYEEVQPWPRAMRARVLDRTMPPWLADPRYGKFRNERTLTAAEIEAMGARRGHSEED